MTLVWRLNLLGDDRVLGDHGGCNITPFYVIMSLLPLVPTYGECLDLIYHVTSA